MDKGKQIFHKLDENVWIDLSVIVLALISVGLLIFEISSDLATSQVALIHAIDFVICLVFLSDFVLGLYVADNKKLFIRRRWPDLVASIPVPTGLFRSLRVLRLLRLLRVMRVLARIRRMGELADEILDDSAKYVYVASITAVVILSAAVGFFSAEFGINPQVHNFFDAVWWAVVTGATVGYGDIYPITWEGRVIGMLLMFFGIGLVGTVAGLAGSYFLERKTQKSDSVD